jgi:L-2-amino-thiazoline-4-carboxylic acid hydrolase
MDIPLIKQVKIQAQVLVPLVKTLQAELGEERANAIVRKALGDLYPKYGEKWWRTQGARNLGEKMASAFDMFAAGDALDYEVVKQTPDAFEVNVTGCRYARFYQEIGAPELGFLLTCSADFPIVGRNNQRALRRMKIGNPREFTRHSAAVVPPLIKGGRFIWIRIGHDDSRPAQCPLVIAPYAR